MITILITLLILCMSKASCTDHEINGYITYCPCMDNQILLSKTATLTVTLVLGALPFAMSGNLKESRFGNQADHFLGALAFSKAINRSLILPPWIEYRYGEIRSIQIPFDTYFDVDQLLEYHNVITMEHFMKEIAPKVWPEHKRVSFCYTQRTGEEPLSCNAKSGNPFGPFWDTYNINFVRSEFYGPLNYDAQNEQTIEQWKVKYPADKWPVLAFTGAPASFPVQKENVLLHKYLKWSREIVNKSTTFIREKLRGGSFLGIHLRNGQDWVKACQHVKESTMLFAAPQCVGYRNERGPLTMSMCFPKSSEIVKQLKRVLKKYNIKHIFVASDSNHMIEELKVGLQRPEITILKLQPSNPHLDLAILGQANYFIGNCVSSYSAFVKRERDTRGLPSEFWSFPQRRKNKHEEL